ncbi:RES family NAD+ phosphorylase (plasmid) [Priestia megaterium]|uniref:RES domain protein n=1 Tax=Priestia megaterium (strain ATCC 14581 / DSM 32 / CCUG 1817 / JCM 2506 / NBRC 15308 / NCIMB 9376 / NCTC 10342 / NRRL B-14308 / VKM B-512 / Ford 19) TaxID=1348623 RepID=A0A0B6AWU3_PRIM2|nr:RES family NAD+ phosphorylase [Priestia megaterium]AJI25577.1 RES domain protein [Priestia megaterium NBRC 15308 = ATCC 14581]KFN07540.1 RES domain protein [Priestia megaterium]KGJ82743.1 hypothetical protein BMT_15910 [Priestia megaterium NBRC 15308 = ATCC 14581]MED4399210.1 RES family NAD+ phosphorylase [Priestia megaterium]MED4737295.1 RES family NAD+ phosphorylase [Priestia megaterium]
MIEGCQSCCYPQLFETFSYLNEDYVPGATRVKQYDNEVEFCPICEIVLLEDDYIVTNKEDFLEEAIEFLAQKINYNIKECQYCNGTIIPYEQQYGDSLNLNLVSELVDEYYIPTELQPQIYSKLKCSCGNPVNSDDPYVSEQEIKDWFGDEFDFIIKTFGISAEETGEFILFLQEHPMLGLEHNIGKTILDKIKKRDFPFIETIKESTVYYRGRTRNQFQRMVPFIAEELWNPPIGFPQQGRFNPPGVTNLYLASEREVVLKEISPQKNDIVDIAEFEIIKDLKVFNSTKSDIDIFASMANDQHHLSFSYEYIFPNFLAQCLSFCGFNGIIYKSVQSENGVNLCLFNFNKDTDIRMNKIHTNANIQISDKEDPFGLKPRPQTIEVKNDIDDDLLTSIF